MDNALTTIRKHGIDLLPNTPRYKCRFDVRSASSNRIYRISYDAADGAGYWTCSCPGCITHGQCKHLTEMGLRGRKFGKHQLSRQEVAALNG